MPFTGFPNIISQLLQQGFLVREMEEGLDSILAYRRLAIQELFPGRIGETMTRTRKGRKVPVTTPMTTYSASSLDNGLTSSQFSIEQYAFTLAEYADTVDLNLMQNEAQIADQFVANARNNGVQAAQSLERICRSKLFGAYLSGNSRSIIDPGATIVSNSPGALPATIAAAATSTNYHVDDIRGFTTVLVNGVVTPVSTTNPLNVVVTIPSTNVTVTAQVVLATAYAYQATFGPGSITTSPDAVPGFLSLKNTSASTYTLTTAGGDVIVSSSAPAILRPLNRLSMQQVVAADVLSLGLIEDAVAYLRDNGVPPMDDGTYHCVLDNTSMRQLFADQDFKVLFAGRSMSPEFREQDVVRLLGVTYVPTTEAYVQNQSTFTTGSPPTPVASGLRLRRPIIVGAESLIQGNFEGMETWLSMKGMDRNDSNIAMVDGVVQIVREPLDRLQQIIAQSWTWIGDYAVPTDLTATSSIIPTASSALYKRAVCIEHAG